MRIGILADIHEHVPFLSLAIERLRRENVDQMVVLGDIFEMGSRIHETIDVLLEENVIGVWGNHELAFCVDPLWRKFDHSVFVVGHFHRWQVSTPGATLTRKAYEPVRFEPGRRYLIVMHAVFEGWCAVLDTGTRQLIPHSIANGH